MKGLFIVLILAIGNLVGHAFWTRPLLEAREKLDSRRNDLEGSLADQMAELGKWQRLGDLLEFAVPALDTIHTSSDSDEFAQLREAFLEAEHGLRLQRGGMDLRPADRVPKGFHGVRVHLAVAGDFETLLKYLDQVSRIKAPIAPVEISLGEAKMGQAPLWLNATWLALWPEETSS